MDGFSPRGRNNKQLNVLGGILEPCKSILQSDKDIITGFYRDNCCNTGQDDFGLHTVCCKMTNEFLDFSKSPCSKYTLAKLFIAFAWLNLLFLFL